MSAESPSLAPETPEQKTARVVDQLERLDITDPTKAGLLLVYLGEKPATTWHHVEERRRPGSPPHHQSRERFDQVVDWAARSGLPYATGHQTVNPAADTLTGRDGELLVSEREKSGRPLDVQAEIKAAGEDDRLVLYVARDEAWLEKMRYASQTHDPELLGECYGFPQTAVEGYLSGDGQAKEARATIPPEDMAFAWYSLSRDHWQDELATAKRWTAAIKKADPTLYERELARRSRRD